MKIARFSPFTPLAFALVVAISACSSDSASPTSSAPAAGFATTDAPRPPSTGVFGEAKSAACTTDQQILGTAIEAYIAFNGDVEVTEAKLVAEQYIREEFVGLDIGPGNSIVATPGGPCVG